VSDQERERLIEAWRTVLELDEPEEKVLASAKMRQLIQQRSPQQVERMERDRGLRAS
jgi:hypothetical protein